MDYPIQPVSLAHLGERVDMIWHHTPCNQGITLTVKLQQCVLHQFGDLGIGEVATAVPLIEHGVGGLDTFGRRFCSKLLAKPNRQAIGKSKDDMLDNIRRIDMRKITARAPTGMIGARCGLRAGETPAVQWLPHRFSRAGRPRSIYSAASCNGRVAACIWRS